MTESLLTSHRLEIGALHRKGVMVRLTELEIPYKEFRGLADSIIIINIYTAEQKTALQIFKREFMFFQNRLREIDEEYKREELARKNRWRRLTFRKPLTSLPAEK
jgi:hypothetical protein